MPKTKPETLAARLRRLRTEAGLSAPELAARAGLTYQAYWRIENGQRPDPWWSTIQAIAQALNISTDALRDE